MKSFLSKDCAWECVFRVRCSTNWNVCNILGNYSILSTNLLAVGNIDDSKTIFYQFSMKNQPSTEAFYIQVIIFSHKIKIFNKRAVCYIHLLKEIEDLGSTIIK